MINWLRKILGRHDCMNDTDVVWEGPNGCTHRCRVCGGQTIVGDVFGGTYAGFEPEPLSKGLYRLYGTGWNYPDEDC